MKKLITLLIALTLGFTAANAQHYRGFADINLSFPLSVKLNGEKVSYPNAGGFMAGFTTSHGVQLKNFFIGAGAGAFLNPNMEYTSPIPLFINGRYDFFGRNRINLFIDCKLGCMIMAGDGDLDILLPDDKYSSVECKRVCAPYFNPSVGVRFRCSKTCGINIAIGYLLFNGKGVDYNSEYTPSTGWSYTDIAEKLTDHRLSLTIGFDF